jgi:hypothetical protein
MSWTNTHPLETVAEWAAPVVLAVAAGWATSAAGLPLAAIAAAGTMGLAVGVVAMRLAGKAPIAAEPAFKPVAFDQATVELSELLLDDPLVEIEPDSRVVQLFARAEPTPGEMVLRIEDYLSDGRRAPPAEELPERNSADASAALQVALANIRASLR